MHHLERYTSPEWPARASHNRRSGPHALGHESVPGTLCIQNVLATAHQTAGATLAGAPLTARLSKCTISSVTRAWSGVTTLKLRRRSTHVLEHAQTHHGIPLHTKDARNSTSDSARNSRGRSPSIQMHHLEHYTGPEWHAHAHNHRNVPHACFQHDRRHRGIPLHAKGARNGSTC